ncbi:MAG: hypothetical protein Q7T56_08790 [Nocardioidaceae bacterium]|nr:hypothetical protein [Nocardioidaceae bacterium]
MEPEDPPVLVVLPGDLLLRTFGALERVRRAQRRLAAAFESMQAGPKGDSDAERERADELSDEVSDLGESLISVARVLFRWRASCVKAGAVLPAMATEKLVTDLRDLIEHHNEWGAVSYEDRPDPWAAARAGGRFNKYGTRPPTGYWLALPDGLKLSHIGYLPIRDLEADLDRLERALEALPWPDDGDDDEEELVIEMHDFDLAKAIGYSLDPDASETPAVD